MYWFRVAVAGAGTSAAAGGSCSATGCPPRPRPHKRVATKRTDGCPAAGGRCPPPDRGEQAAGFTLRVRRQLSDHLVASVRPGKHVDERRPRGRPWHLPVDGPLGNYPGHRSVAGKRVSPQRERKPVESVLAPEFPDFEIDQRFRTHRSRVVEMEGCWPIGARCQSRRTAPLPSSLRAILTMVVRGRGGKMLDGGPRKRAFVVLRRRRRLRT